jgi:hypothetical protein
MAPKWKSPKRKWHELTRAEQQQARPQPGSVTKLQLIRLGAMLRLGYSHNRARRALGVSEERFTNLLAQLPSTRPGPSGGPTETRTSVRTVSGGLPTLGKRR